MHLAEFRKVMEDLAGYFGKKLNEAQSAVWYGKIGWADGRDVAAAAEEIVGSERYFPTPAQFLKVVDEVRARRAGRELAADARDAKTFMEPRRYGKQLARDCMLVIRRAFSERGSGRSVVDGMRALDAVYPDIGFSEQAAALESDLDRRDAHQAITKGEAA